MAKRISISRRQFLEAVSVAAGGSLLSSRSRGDSDHPLMLPPDGLRACVSHVQSSHVVDGQRVHPALLREMLEAAVTGAVPGAANSAEAWQRLLKPDDVVGIKFNQSGQREIGTSEHFAEALVEGLGRAGTEPGNVVLIEAPAGLAERLGTRRAWPGYTKESFDFGSGADELAACVNQVTALISVPFLKTHNIAGLTGAMKNLSHGLTKHPARYHAHGCSPFIADIVNLPPIREKLRLSIVDALRAVCDGGPAVTEQNVEGAGIVLASLDPVAVDAIGFLQLNELRRARGMARLARSPAEIAYLAAAHRRGLGIALPHGIDVARLEP